MTQTTDFISTILTKGESKKCTKCGQVHALNWFNFSDKSNNVRHPHCKDCTRAASRLRAKNGSSPKRSRSSRSQRWGFSEETIQDFIDFFGGKCAVCGCTDRSQLILDHDHDTNEIRGVLCRKHNSAIGFMEDSLEYVENAYNYLKKHYSGERNYTIVLTKTVHRKR